MIHSHRHWRRAALSLALASPIIAYADSRGASYQYDAAGNLTLATDASGQSVKNTFDGFSRKVQIQDGTGAVTKMEYDGLGQLSSITDPRGLATRYQVGGDGLVSQITNPDTGTASYTYDENGNVRSYTDAKGQGAMLVYDALDRVVSVTYTDGAVTSYTYDQGSFGAGRLTQISDPTGTTQHEYDQYGQIIRQSRSIMGAVYTTAYQYNSAGRMTGIVYPGGRAVSYTRDSLGRVSNVSANVNGQTVVLAKDILYAPFGDVQSLTFGNGESFVRTYGLDGLVSSFSVQGLLQKVGYDAGGKITSIAAADDTVIESFLYDAAGRLTTHQQATTSRVYSYDAVGNRTGKRIGPAQTIYSYDTASNRLVKTSGSSVALVGSDANGSISSIGPIKLNYDARGRMMSSQTSVGLVQYKINSLGERVAKQSTASLTIYHYDLDGKLISEQTGAAITDYVYLDAMPIAVLK